MKKKVLLSLVGGGVLLSVMHDVTGSNSTQSTADAIISSMVVRFMQDQPRIKLKRRQTFEGSYKAFFSPDGRLLALMGVDEMELIELASSRVEHHVAPRQAKFFAAAFSPTGSLLAINYITGSGSSEALDKLTLWDTLTGTEIRTLVSAPPGLSRADNLSFGKDGQWIASHIGNVARITEVEAGTEIRQFPPPTNPPGVKPLATLSSPDGKWLAIFFSLFNPARPYDAIHVYELDTGREIVLDTNIYRDWRFSSDSKTLAVTSSIDRGKPTQRALAEFWEVGTWVRKRVIEVPTTWQGAFTVAVSPDGETAAIGGRKMFGLFSMATGELLAEKPHPTQEFDSQLRYDLTWIEFSSDGRFLVTGGNDSRVNLWKIKRLN